MCYPGVTATLSPPPPETETLLSADPATAVPGWGFNITTIFRIVRELTFTCYWVLIIYALWRFDSACDAACTPVIWQLSLSRIVFVSTYGVSLSIYNYIRHNNFDYDYDEDADVDAIFMIRMIIAFCTMATFVALGISIASSAMSKPECVSALTASTGVLSIPLLIVLALISCGVDALAAMKAEIEVEWGIRVLVNRHRSDVSPLAEAA